MRKSFRYYRYLILQHIQMQHGLIFLDNYSDRISSNLPIRFDPARPLMITFAPGNSVMEKEQIDEDGSPWGFEFIKKQDLNILSFASMRPQNWYRTPGFSSFVSTVKLPKFKEIIGYGSSMGGYGLSAFGDVLNIERVLLFNPISTLNHTLAPWENRYRYPARHLDWSKGNIDGSVLKCKGFVVYDPLMYQDSRHVKKYGSSLERIKLFGMGHGLPSHLQDMGCLKQIVVSFISNTLDKTSIQSIFRKRREQKRYYQWMLSKENRHLTPPRAAIIRQFRARQFPVISATKDHKRILSNSEVSALRDIALKLEATDINLALSLMNAAAQFRKGPFIINKIAEYQQKLLIAKSQHKVT